MSSDPYRGDRAALQARLAALDEEIATLEAAFDRVFWERVAPQWNIARPGTPLSEGDPISAREHRIALLHDATERARGAVAAAPALAGSGPSRRGGLLDAVLDDPRVVEALEALAAHSPGASVGRVARARWCVRASLESVPIEATVTRVARRAGVFWRWRITTTSVLGALLHLRPEGFFQDMLELVRLGKEIETGDPELDPTFVIAGDDRCAHALLTPDVRRDLIHLASLGRTILAVDGGLARLELTGSLGAGGVSIATRVLAAIHRAPPTVALVRTEPADGE